MKITTKEGQYESNDPLFLQSGGEVNATAGIYGSNYRDLSIPQGATTASESKTSKSKNEDILDKDVLSDLVGKGITSDVDASMQDLMTLQQSYQQLDIVDKNSSQGMMILNKIAMVRLRANRLLRNAEMFKNAQQEVVKRNAMSELAITEAGLILQDVRSGKITQVAPEVYASLTKEEKENYRTLTNAGLISEREYGEYLQNDVESFQQLNSSTSLNQIQSELKDIMSSVTSSKSEETYDQYTQLLGVGSKNNKLKEGLDHLKTLSDTPIDNILVTLSKDSNEGSIKEALEAMWLSLSDNGKTLLKSKAALQGYDKSQLDLAAKSYLVSLLKPKYKQDMSSKYTVDFGKDENGNKKSGSGESGSMDKNEYNFWELFANDKMPRDLKLFGPEGTSHQLTLPVGTYGPIRTKNQEPYSNTPLGRISEINTVADKDAGSFGGDMVLSNTLQEGIQYHGADLHRVTMPYKMDPHTHKIIPDFKYVKNYESQIREISTIEQQGKTLTVGERQQIFKKYGLTDLDINGNPRNVKDFQATTVYVGETTYDKLDEVSKQNLIEEDNDEQKAIMKSTFTKDRNNADLFGKNDDVYKGIIYYPIYSQAGVISGAINDGKGIKLGDINNRTLIHQSRTGVSNQSLTQSMNMDLLNNMIQQK